MYESGNELVTEDPIVKEDTEQEEERHSKQATDLYTDIVRLEKLIRKQVTNYKRSKTDEYKIKYANCIGLLSQKKTDLVCIVLKVEELIKGKTYYRPK